MLLGNMPLVSCTETIETVSISGSYQLGESTNNTILQHYRKCNTNYNLSLHQFFHKIKNDNPRKKEESFFIPHYVGGSSQPVYPPTIGYANAILLIHKPWYPGNNSFMDASCCLEEFEWFIQSDSCPMSVKISYEHV